MPYIPQRKCIACQLRKPKEELLRFARIDDKVVPDNEKKLNGRGFYLCNNAECIQKCIKKKLLHKIFKRNNIDYSAIEAINER